MPPYRTYYQILGLSEEATQESIKRRFVSLNQRRKRRLQLQEDTDEHNQQRLINSNFSQTCSTVERLAVNILVCWLTLILVVDADGMCGFAENYSGPC
jgi:hypothetical protein